MSEFRTVPGFEEVWRPVGGRRLRPDAVLRPPPQMLDLRARLWRVARRAPEVMVKVTGRIRTRGHLRAHLDYISRHGRLELEGPDGFPLEGRAGARELADDWADLDKMDRRRRSSSPLSLSIVLSMPKDTDPVALRDAAHAFALAMFGDRHEYALVLHTDAGHPHVHLAVRALSDGGGRLNPRKGDLQAWRDAFALALRDRGVEAEATPRRSRGVTRKSEKAPVRRISERRLAGLGPAPATLRAAYVEAALAASGRDTALRPWEVRLAARQARIRGVYRAQAQLLRTTGDARDTLLAEALDRFVAEMPRPGSRRLALARELREAQGRDREALRGARGDRSR